MNNQARLSMPTIILFLVLAFHLRKHLSLTTLTAFNHFNYKNRYFCLMKILIGEPVSFQLSRILFSRKRL